MTEWAACGSRFIEADVIRWREPIWKPKKNNRAKPRKIGERVVTAEVLKREAAGWVRLKITACETVNADDWVWTIPALKVGSVTRRQSANIGRGRAHRLLWSDESARRSVIEGKPKPPSRFLMTAPSR